MNRWVAALLLFLPLLVVVGAMTADEHISSKPFGRFTIPRATATPPPEPFEASMPLAALSVLESGAICAVSTDDAGGSDPHVGRIVLVDIAAGGPVDPDAVLGPVLDPGNADGLQFVTVTLRQPAWTLAPGDVVTLVVVPPERPGTPTPVAERARLPRVERVTIITVPWASTSEPGAEGQALVALPAGNDAFVDLVAAGRVAVPIGKVPATPRSVSTSPPDATATAVPTVAQCPTPTPHPTAAATGGD